ncbi:hypothetical protein D3P07_25065 [Paenibacillus sp. 1011MAR3C5]|uniref:hypothetical protein n=1 Tax=Paenibacillus sp. 1011MAR3C5 TaxID=1675787 RepID=UPI000E6BCEAE|nr:hypothetical protein [Paenibacillus sp. 1011MAR3C5]RJE83623.1 hypothetical protein D3P07_25065 [Paenibacillus sp. 1011MAR3C5]
MLELAYTFLLRIRRRNFNGKMLFYIRRALKLLVNIIYPIYYNIFPTSKTGININKNESDEKIIISLTTFPARINTVWLCIETLLRQKKKPDEIVLWLADSQFESIDQLPKNLIKQQERGLTIKFCEDLRPHKKYYYTIKENPNANVIIVDDDMYYPNFLVEMLIDKSKAYPGAIICNRGRFMKFNENNSIAPYKLWTNNSDTNEPSYALCPIGCDGVLYPPNTLHLDVFNKDDIYNLCLNADDLWLKLMSLRVNTKAVKTDVNMISFFDIITTQKTKLTSLNVENDGNDIQMQNILKKYNIDFSDYNSNQKQVEREGHE